MSIDNPVPYETINGRRLGFANKKRYQWYPCQLCGRYRWVQLKAGIPSSIKCSRCLKKKIPTRDEIDSYIPKHGDERRGRDLGFKSLSSLYRWFPCPSCNTYSWKIIKKGKLHSPKCKLCGTRKPSPFKGINKVIRSVITTPPYIGEIRYADELGKGRNIKGVYNTTYGQKYIWAACTICGKQKWIALDDYKGINHKCQSCCKIGLMHKSSLLPTRVCSCCKNEYPNTKEFFSVTPYTKLGITRTCRNCSAIKRRRHYKNTYKFNIKKRIHRAMSSSIRKAIKHRKNGRRWESLVGYTLNDLMNYLEKKFINGMGWDNYGINGWVIDHIIPRTAFCYTSPTDIDFKRCWQLANLQPLWFRDNCVKHASIEEPFQPYLPITVTDK